MNHSNMVQHPSVLNTFRAAKAGVDSAMNRIRVQATEWLAQEILRAVSLCIAQGLGTESDGDLTFTVAIASYYTDAKDFTPLALLRPEDVDLARIAAESMLRQTYGREFGTYEVRQGFSTNGSLGSGGVKRMSFTVKFMQSPF